ncbi:MAG: DUF5996 family protein [Aggregatilineales bacterium]
MDLPRLHADMAEWQSTRTSLHQAAEVVGKVRKAMIDPLPNALHLSLHIVPEGLSTARLSDDTTLVLDIKEALVKRLNPEGRISETWLLADYTQQSLASTLATAFEIDISAEGDEPLKINTRVGVDYAIFLYRVYTAFARFRATLFGTMSPVVVWTHHFDLSFVWFTGNEPDEHNKAHINFGFAPFSDGVDLPYIYMYGWSPEGGYAMIEPAFPVKFQTEGFTGAVIDYEALRRFGQPEAMIESELNAIYRQFRAKLES